MYFLAFSKFAKNRISKCMAWVAALQHRFAKRRQKRMCPESRTHRTGRAARHFVFLAACSVNLKSVYLIRAFWSACKMSFEDIIIKIQNKPILWMPAHPNYKNWAMKAKLWRELATTLGIQGQFLYIQGGPKVSSLELQ